MESSKSNKCQLSLTKLRQRANKMSINELTDANKNYNSTCDLYRSTLSPINNFQFHRRNYISDHFRFCKLSILICTSQDLDRWPRHRPRKRLIKAYLLLCDIILGTCWVPPARRIFRRIIQYPRIVAQINVNAKHLSVRLGWSGKWWLWE